MKTVINIKTDKKLKTDAQGVAKNLGLPLGTIINSYLRELVQEERVVFSNHPIPNKRTQKFLDRLMDEKDSRKDTSGPFSSAAQTLSHLDSLKN